MVSIEYEDFLDLEYKPNETDLICEFYVEPAKDMSMEDAAGRVASESSNGTWSGLEVDERIREMSATTFSIEDNIIRIAYPETLFEPNSMPQILSCIAGNIMGMKAVDRIRLRDCVWPESIVKDFPGPQYGSSVRKKIFDAEDRPITATVPKPKVGLTTEQHAKIGYEAWTGGIDLLKDDENLTDQSFNRFKDRVKESLKMRDKAENETGEKKSYLINITGDTETMLDRAEFVAEQNGEYVMVDIITAGWASLQSVRKKCEELGLAIHAHRAMHAAFDRLDQHGVSMRCIAQFARLCGVDQIHTGTANLGKLENEDTIGINDWLRSDLYGLNDVLPVASGGLHPGILPKLLDILGQNICIQVGGGIHGHPDGTHAGSKAVRQAIDSTIQGRDIQNYAEGHPELKRALDKWGDMSPR
ncbi:ribulose 1,5-bisphosphate carboxylase [candidate division MSBL1 archaeon SCGC-AAA259I09]|uniref:Ribulose bisphosphate carboxylase n=5 Tax=candidate division MSBL1 TaxID=215777 RepID=A0A133UPW4_9EURY|nr:ribulose 1,5-bisphosphate carboxylase [candidate division MSBL1 archaeon SCGC-AAA259E22]KXA96241.1 ribulose 1,5-bisphosphate carboxylase [candidate division MSBL1 archaeon SCGC-AAA259I14]KXA96740.1 ribulose 1,5-bisphosphate carboxylase [candidate division MSBL1 archaeon SCGC-AAA259I09]